MKDSIISLHAAVASDASRRLRRPIDFELNRGEHIALVGDNGSGKTLVVETVTSGLYLQSGSIDFRFGNGRHAYEAVRTVRFDDAYGTADAGHYHQRRWNSTDREAVPTAGEILSQVRFADRRWRDELYEMLGIGPLLDKEIILLSSGELRKMHIARAMASAPEVLVIESPYIGLDAPARRTLDELLQRIAPHTAVISTLTSAAHLPPSTTHVYPVDNMVLGGKIPVGEYVGRQASGSGSDIRLPSAAAVPAEYRNVIEMHGVTIRYGHRTILDRIDWLVKRGQKWSIVGSNGSGKSTLLSLVCADNPQAYSQNIVLFDRRRGTGESIWDIKRRIGYLSPELHRAFRSDTSAEEVVASGFFDTTGFFRSPSAEQLAAASDWLRTFGAEALLGRPFGRLSSGEQRLLLLARAMVKDPELLILDEPFQGFDPQHTARARAIIDAFCRRPDKTLLFVTHFPDESPECIDRTLRLQACANG